jgi:hypothetical protein
MMDLRGILGRRSHRRVIFVRHNETEALARDQVEEIVSAQIPRRVDEREMQQGYQPDAEGVNSLSVPGTERLVVQRGAAKFLGPRRRESAIANLESLVIWELVLLQYVASQTVKEICYAMRRNRPNTTCVSTSVKIDVVVGHIW